jgi:hypothetical protein
VELAGVILNIKDTDGLISHIVVSFTDEEWAHGFETALSFDPIYQGMGVLFTKKHA